MKKLLFIGLLCCLLFFFFFFGCFFSILLLDFIFVLFMFHFCYSFSLLLNNFFYPSAFKLFLAFYICLFFSPCFHCFWSHYFLPHLFPVSIHFLYAGTFNLSLYFFSLFFFHPLSLFLSRGMVNGRSESNVAAIQRATSFFQLISPKLLLFSMN